MKKTEAKSSGRRSGGLSSWGNLVVDVFKSKATVIGALPTLVLGAAFISAMVGAIEDHNQLQDQLTRLSGEATAQVEKVWWRFDVDTETLTKDGASNWGAYTRPTLCVRLGQLVSEVATASVSCLRYAKILDGYRAPSQLPEWTEGGTGWVVDVPWRTPEANPGIEIHMAQGAWRWFTTTPSVYETNTKSWSPRDGHGETGSATYWHQFINRFDRPARLLIDQWQRSNRIDALFDPENPDIATPASFVSAAEDTRTLPFMIAGGLFGILFWSVGVMILLHRSKLIWRVIVIVATLAAAPWWGQTVWRGLDFLHADASTFGEFIDDVMLRRAPTVVLMSPEFDGQAEDKRFAWSVGSGLYEPILEGIELAPPVQPLDKAAAEQRASQLVDDAMSALPPQDRARRFWLLACYSAEGLRGAGSLFLGSAERWRSDPVVGKAVQTFLRFHTNGGTHNHSINCAEML